MSDLNPDKTRRNPSQTMFKRVWLSRGSQLLVGRRGGFKAIFWAIAVNFILFSLFLAYAVPVYETNDDLIMQTIASGFYTGHPDGHLVFTNILIGWALRFLYGTWPGCNWYLAYLLVVHFAALTAIAFLVVSRRGGWLFTLLYMGFFMFIEMHILLHLQFTTTAFLAGTAGLLLLVDGLQPDHRVYWPKVIIGIAFAGLMCLIREPVALLLAVIAGPFFLERIGLANWRRLFGIGLACAFIFLILHGINRWSYQHDPAWAEFSEYNRMRGEIHGTSLAKWIPEAAPAVGWSKNDGWMFSQFYFSDPKVYAGVPKMHHFLDRLKMLAQAEPPFSSRFPANFLFLPGLFLRDSRDAGPVMNLAILNAIWCILVAGAFRRPCLVTLLVSYGLDVGLVFYLLATARLPERVSYNIPLFINAICLYWATGFRNLPPVITRPDWLDTFLAPFWRARDFRLATLAVMPIGIALYLLNMAELTQSLWSANASNQKLELISHKILRPINTLLPAPKTPLLIPMPFNSVLEQCIFFYPSTEKAPFFLVPYGWITHSPLFSQILERNGLRPYSLSLVDRPDVFFLMGGRWLEPLRIFYREHYGLNVRFDMVLDTSRIPPFEDCQLFLYQAHSAGSNAPVEMSP
jgi:hypothetical protein